MNTQSPRRRTFYLLMGMLIVAILAFLLFYIFLIDTFQIFSTQKESLGSVLVTEDKQEEVLSPFELDAQSSLSPAHGEESQEKYPTEELILFARELAQWLYSWYDKNRTKPFPLVEFAHKIQNMHFSEGNIVPLKEDVPNILLYALPFFIDSLFLESHIPATQKEPLTLYLLSFARHAHAVLDCIRTIPSVQQQDFIEMIRLTQSITALTQELTSLNNEIQNSISQQNSNILPALAEKKFTLQKTKEEQEIILEQYHARFAPFYARAEIRHLPSPVVHAIVATFMYYTPVEQWNIYAQQLIVLMNQSITILEEHAKRTQQPT